MKYVDLFAFALVSKFWGTFACKWEKATGTRQKATL